jgi:hypothetical protein
MGTHEQSGFIIPLTSKIRKNRDPFVDPERIAGGTDAIL